MIKHDFHVHSSFSGDSDTEMELMIKQAISLNLDSLCITEHYDEDLVIDGVVPNLLDFEGYQEHLLELKDKYSKEIDLLLGIEFGIQPYLYPRLSEVARQIPFDFILCSNHVVNGMDPYTKEYYNGKSKQQAYQEYFEELLMNATNFQDYDVYGHLDYVIRYGPYEEKQYLYKDFTDVLDALLKIIIHNGKGIELNTSGYRYQLGNPHPTIEVIKRYRELGGEIITIGSDAHCTEQLCAYFDQAEAVLKNAGFKYYTVFKNRKPEFISF